MKILLSTLFTFAICFTSFGRADLTEDLVRHSLQSDHPFYRALDNIFSSPKTLNSEKNLIKAGFTIIQLRNPQFVIAKHPALPGHLVKLYLRSSSRSLECQWKNTITRCNNAEKLRDLIKKNNIKRFTVPDKWIYTTKQQDPILIVTKMNIVSEEQSRYAWKHLIKNKHLQELFCIIRHGCGSSKLIENIPYTKEGMFTCIDTEKPSQGDSYLKKYLSKKMRNYWDFLIKQNKKQPLALNGEGTLQVPSP